MAFSFTLNVKKVSAALQSLGSEFQIIAPPLYANIIGRKDDTTILKLT